MEVILQIIILLLIYSIYKNPKVGIPLFVSYYFLVPYCKLDLGFFSLQNNFVYLLIFLAVIYRHREYDFKPFYGLFCFFTLILLTIPLTNGVGSDYQFNALRVNAMTCLLLPMSIWMMRTSGYLFFKNFQSYIITVIIIACVYGLILTTMSGVNPYIMMFYDISGSDYLVGWYATSSRLFGRISSVFMHPMRFAMFLGCALIYILSLRTISTGNKIFLLIIIGLNCLFCGVRSLLFAILITAVFFLLMCRKFKVIFVSSIISALLIFFISLSPELSDYLLKVFNTFSGDESMSGSTLTMRFEQLEACFKEINDCQTFGKGYMWHEYYILTFGNHPEILAFESLIFVIICNQGYFGFVVWGLLFFIMYRMQKKYIRERMNRLILSCYMVFYISYCVSTGEYNYMIIFLIFYFFTFSKMYLHSKKTLNNFIRTNELE